MAAGAVLGFALAAPKVCLADDASFFGDGATVYALKESRVLMQKETVVIRYDEKEDYRQWHADCTFVFVNQSEQVFDVQMGFPDWSAEDESTSNGWAIQGFSVQIDGATVETEHKEVLTSSEADALLPPGGAAEYRGAYTWPVHFPARSKHVVHNVFAFGGLSTYGPFAAEFTKPGFAKQSLFWRASGANEKIGGCDYDVAVFKRIQYIVTTARTWGGPIGEANIAIQIPSDAFPTQLIPSPPATSMGGGMVRWHRTNWTPSEEIALYVTRPIGEEECQMPPLFDSLKQAQAWIKFARANGMTHDAVEAVRNAYWARPRTAQRPQDAKIVGLLDWFARTLRPAKQAQRPAAPKASQ